MGGLLNAEISMFKDHKEGETHYTCHYETEATFFDELGLGLITSIGYKCTGCENRMQVFLKNNVVERIVHLNK